MRIASRRLWVSSIIIRILRTTSRRFATTEIVRIGSSLTKATKTVLSKSRIVHISWIRLRRYNSTRRIRLGLRIRHLKIKINGWILFFRTKNSINSLLLYEKKSKLQVVRFPVARFYWALNQRQTEELPSSIEVCTELYYCSLLQLRINDMQPAM